MDAVPVRHITRIRSTPWLYSRIVVPSGIDPRTPKAGMEGLEREATLPEVYAHLTKVEFELFAKTPGGPESISKCQGYIETGKATGRIPVYIPQYRDEAGNLLAKVEYFFTAKHAQSELLKDERAVKVVDKLANPFLECQILQDVTFATGKSFLSPKNAPALRNMVNRIKEWKEKHAYCDLDEAP